MLLCLLMMAPSAYGQKKHYDTWHLNVHFVVGAAEYSNARGKAAIDQWIAQSVQVAEDLYAEKPSLKIAYTTEHKTRAGGRNLAQLNFDSSREYKKFMDDHFENVATTKTEGHLTILVANDVCYGKGDKKTCIGGRAWFPHWVDPTSRKYGISLAYPHDQYVFSHELGHMLSLLHTFEPYVNVDPKLNCNKDYRPHAKCATCEGEVVEHPGGGFSCKGRSNVMDYCASETSNEYINPCQERRTANQRKTYMTNKGETNYFKLKGTRGAPTCSTDSDCDAGRYCNTGVAGIGRNQCKELKDLGQSCTRAGQCESGRCNAGQCKAANECTTDAHCGANAYCDTGTLGVGQNLCRDLKPIGAGCTRADQCASGRCNTGQCKEAHDCSTDADCGPNAVCKLGPLGIGRNECIATQSPTCPSGWTYDVRNPLNKDRCTRTTTQTAALKCRLLVTDNRNNWTGPHAQAGADECRSTKGKAPKGVKCPSGYTYNQRSGADTCTKSVTNHQPPTCPNGWDYKSQNGRDICQDK